MKKVLYHGSEFLIKNQGLGGGPPTMITEEVFIVQKI